MAQRENTPPASVRVLRILWIGMVFSVILYIVIAMVVARAENPPTIESILANPLVLILYAMGVVNFFLSSVIAAMIARRANLNEPGSARRSRSLQSIQQESIVRWAFLESTSIFGLVAAFLMSQWQLMIPMVALSLLGFLKTYPSTEAIAAKMDSAR